MTDNAPGWQPDPTGRHDHRYWDGSAWTDNVADAGVASTDAYEVVDAPEPTMAVGEVAATPTTPPPGEAPTEAVPTASGWADPTTTFPAVSSDPTSTWGSPPPPPSYTPPPAPAGPLGPDGSGGSKRGLLIGGAILAAVVVAVIAFMALGGDDDESDVRTQLAAQFRGNSGLSDDQADCVADHVVDEIGADRFEDVDFDADEPPAELADDLFAAATGSLEACDIDPADFAGTGDDDADDDDDASGDVDGYGDDDELDALYDDCEAGDYQACDDLYNQSPSGSAYEDFGDTCGERNEPQGFCVDVYDEDGDDAEGGDDLLPSGDLPPGFEDQLADVYAESMGIEREKAECLAEKIGEAVRGGELSEEESMSEIFSYFSDCDIDMSEISGN
jgi:hypothetical protein